MSGRSEIAHGPWRWTAAVGAALTARVAARAHRLANEDYWRRNTAMIQIQQLRRLLERAQATAFGREHDFARIARIEEPMELLAAYRAAVPIRDWYAFRDMIAQMREHGEPNVLWPGKVRDFAQTSGTTAGDKYIPVSEAMLRSNYRASLDIFAYMVHRGISLPRICSGRCLFLGGSSDLKTNAAGVRTGDLSGIVTPLIRWPISAIYSPGPVVALMNDWPAKIETMAKLTLEQDIRFISGMPSWALVLMTRVLEMARGLGRRAECVHDVWPHLEIFVHGGVNYAPFRSRINELVTGDRNRDLPHRHELYPASEGFIAMQDREHEPGLRLCSDIGNFIEFVPLGHIDDPNPVAFTCDQVERGQRYVVVLSTCAGLWRYILGDVVEFDDIPDSLDDRPGTGPARLRIVGRHRHFINAFGENLIVEHIENAVAEASRVTGIEVGEFTAAPVYPGPDRPAGLELAIEMPALAGGDTGSDAAGLAAFAEAFDKALKTQNVDYTTKRTGDLGMGLPTITPLPAGAFHRWMERVGKLGGQHKCPRCANHRDLIEAVVRAESRVPAGKA
ncbi:MAG: GH3 auxin-responsive promoter family protein [Phycisphaerales bacterium]